MKRVYAILAVALLAYPMGSVAQSVPASQVEISLSFAPVVKAASPAVVNIYASRIVEGRSSPFSADPFFEEFFRDFGTPTPRVQNALGSGVILTQSGLVVSNYHVVGGATDIRVVLTDRREFKASVVMSDEESDLAVLRLDGAMGLPWLELRASDNVEVGELVLAIGNPFGVGQTVSSGIVSGLARSALSLGSGRGYFIQTDAPINPGNSGGALVDMAGRVVGINSAILTRSGGSNGVGFAIPADLVAQILKQAETGADQFLRPWAGMTGQAVDAQIAEALGLSRPAGVLITELHPQSPFAAAGLQVGDVITDFSGAEVNSPLEVMYRLSVAGIGGTAAIQYLHDGKQIQASVDLIAPPSSGIAALTIEEGGLAGLSVAQVDPAVAARFGLPMTAEGVVVTDLQGILTRSGLAIGDILQIINGVEIKSAEDVAAVAASGANGWAIVGQRNGQSLLLRFRL